jgi:outer membrane lipopolysaccharide assembly protein LptE/RlpB
VIRRSLAVAALLAALLSTSCGYALAGRGSSLPATIKTIGVPDFVNRTPYFETAGMLSQRVRSELIGRGRYKVLPQDTDVDAVLRITLNNVSLTPTGFNESQQATRYVVTVSVSAQFVQTSDNKVLWQNPNQVFREEYQQASGGTSVVDPATFFGQQSNAVTRMSSDFARTIVSALLEAF